MGAITFTFEDLCMMFTEKPGRLMVGLPKNGDAPVPDIHFPHLMIEEEGGGVVSEYHGSAEIFGDIFLDVYPNENNPLTFLQDPQSANSARQSIEAMPPICALQSQPELVFKPENIQARMHFRNGEIYSIGPLTEIRYVEAITLLQANPPAPLNVTFTGAIDIQISPSGYAVLFFSRGSRDFVFKGTKNYKVRVTNKAASVTSPHFKYFYDFAENPPGDKLIPAEFSNGQIIGPENGGDPFCSGCRTCSSNYNPLTTHLDW